MMLQTFINLVVRVIEICIIVAGIAIVLLAMLVMNLFRHGLGTNFIMHLVLNRLGMKFLPRHVHIQEAASRFAEK